MRAIDMMREVANDLLRYGDIYSRYDYEEDGLNKTKFFVFDPRDGIEYYILKVDGEVILIEAVSMIVEEE